MKFRSEVWFEDNDWRYRVSKIEVDAQDENGAIVTVVREGTAGSKPHGFASAHDEACLYVVQNSPKENTYSVQEFEI